MKEATKNVWNIIYSINNDTQEKSISIRIKILSNGMRMNYLIKYGKFYSLEFLQEQIEELKKEITTLTKSRIIEELEN